MKNRSDVITFCLSLPDSYEDYPFRDQNWTIMRHKSNRKMFAAICERQGNIWVNVKCNPAMTFFWRNAFEAVIPAYHMNKEHWNSLILNGTIPTHAIQQMIADSYDLTQKRIKHEKRGC